MVSPSPGLAGGPEPHQQLASRAEFDHLMPPGAFGRALLGDRIGDPDVAVPVDIDAMGPDDRPAPEAIDGVPVHVELHDRIEVRIQALVAEPRHGGRIAANHRPEVSAVLGPSSDPQPRPWSGRPATWPTGLPGQVRQT